MDPALRVADVTVRSLREGKDNGGKKTKEETKTLKGYEEDGRTEEEAFSHRPKGGTFRPPVADSKLKYKDRDGYTGIFSLTYTEMEKHGFARKTFYNAIKDLTEKGFVEVISTGGLRGAGHTNSKYRLSKRWQLYHLETKPKPLWRFPSEP